MLALAAIFGGSFALALSGALMPGPLLTVTVSESARIGSKAGPLLITGYGMLELLLVVALILGLGPFLKSPMVMGIIALVGGDMLVWMGIDMLRNSGKASLFVGVVAPSQPFYLMKKSLNCWLPYIVQQNAITALVGNT